MCITLKTQTKGNCIDCGNPHHRDPKAWRCWSCDVVVGKFRSQFGRYLKKAISSGEMQPATAHICVDCGAPAVDWDHRDYRNIADVEPVCRSCNQQRGPAIWQEGITHGAPTQKAVS